MKNNLKLNFDCASPNEIRMINQQDGNHNNFHSDIIYANPVKAISHLTFAASSNVKKVTVDSVEEFTTEFQVQWWEAIKGTGANAGGEAIN